MKKITFPDNFLFGTATSAAQGEGGAFEDGRGMSIWDAFARIPGAIGDASLPDRACDMYHTCIPIPSGFPFPGPGFSRKEREG